MNDAGLIPEQMAEQLRGAVEIIGELSKMVGEANADRSRLRVKCDEMAEVQERHHGHYQQAISERDAARRELARMREIPTFIADFILRWADTSEDHPMIDDLPQHVADTFGLHPEAKP